MRSFLATVWNVILILIIFAFLVFPSAAAVTSQASLVVSTSASEVKIVADDAVLAVGFKVNGVEYTNPVYVVRGGDVMVILNSLPRGKQLHTVVEGNAAQVLTDRSIRLYNIRSERVIVTLSFGTPSIPENPTPTPTPSEPDTPSPSEPVRPDVPDTPGTPDTDTPGTDTPGTDTPGTDTPGTDTPGTDTPGTDTPGTDTPGTDTPGTDTPGTDTPGTDTPGTDTPGSDTPGSDTPGSDTPGSDTPGSDEPGSDEPGSDEPYLPILPPADSVYNLAGFIPLGAGFLLLFLVFFWKRKVYRILKAHAKKHGEKPEKEHLKEIADAIIKLVRDEGRYPEWKKNSDVMRRLGVDICELLDEMNYPKIVPREALATEILKAAKGRLNRHRL